MKHITSTALGAGAQENCARSEERTLPGMGSITHQPAFRPVSRRAIMSAVNTCSRDLGLRQGAVVVLDALLSCLPCHGPDGSELPVSSTTLLTVFASNETLCFRAKGLTDRQLRRHLATLEEASLLLRRDSANGKRFPILKGGKVIGAFGLDLSPLFARADELLALALRRREEAQELRGLRAQILHLRATCLELHLDHTLATFVDGLRNLVRRVTLTLIEARAALAQLTAVMADHLGPTHVARPANDLDDATEHPQPTERNIELARKDALQDHPYPVACPPRTAHHDLATTHDTLTPTDETPVTDGQNVRHTEPESDTKKRKQGSEHVPLWSELAWISDWYPEPVNSHETAIIAFEFGKMLRISQNLLASAVAKLGVWELLRIENQMAKDVETIQSPDAYLNAILRA